MPSKITLTPKDCLYLEDTINANFLLVKELHHITSTVTDEKIKKHIETNCTSLKKQAECLLKVLEG